MWTQGAEHQVLELGDQCLVIVCEANGEDNLPRAFEQLLEFRLDGIDESGRDRLEEGTCEPVFELRGAIVEVTEVETEQINAIVGVEQRGPSRRRVPGGLRCSRCHRAAAPGGHAPLREGTARRDHPDTTLGG